ncbi:MAG: hypothetical protein QXW58_01780, partial [Thermosphaera sp.]
DSERSRSICLENPGLSWFTTGGGLGIDYGVSGSPVFPAQLVEALEKSRVSSMHIWLHNHIWKCLISGISIE